MTDDLLLHWPSPVRTWFEAAPVGNGRLGAMVFGDVLQINDSTVWSGTPSSPSDGLAEVLAAGAGPERLAKLRAAVRAADYPSANALVMAFEGRYSQEYLPFVDLSLSYEDGQRAYGGRTLNLDNGVVADSFELSGRSVRRRTWASKPASAICTTVEGDSLDVTLRLSSQLRIAELSVDANGFVIGVDVPVDGAPQHEPAVAEPLRYGGVVNGYDPYAVAAVRLTTDGSVDVSGDSIVVRGLTRLLVTVSSSSSGEDFWADAPPLSRADHVLRAVRRASAALAQGDSLLSEHERDLRALLGGMSLSLGRRSGVVDVAEDVLSGKDERLAATVIFQLGRYLLASASRPGGGPPANLQGMWNTELRPPWSSNYTVNINTEMNYWAAETAGLSACHEPLFGLIEKVASHGAEVARELYGAGGWVAHHNTDMWGWALPVGMGHGDPSWAIWMMGGAWISQHLWDHYEFTLDVAFLRDRAWPLLRGCAEFLLDWLVEAPDGHLDTIPSTSPENLFISPHGTVESLSYSSAMDLWLIRAVFAHCQEALRILEISDPLADRIAAALPRLRQPQVTADGRLQEWAEDYQEQDPQHRHLSHLVSVYPLGQISAGDPLAEAAGKVLDRRGPGAMGWSWAWKIALRARLGDGAAAFGLLREAITPYERDPDVYSLPEGTEWGGLLPNLFSTHPPFQMDGNFGLTAGILEMLVQSHNQVIHILPALPAQWPDGEIRGAVCRGAASVDFSWRDGELVALTVRAGAAARVRYRDVVVEVPAGETQLGPGLGSA
jgi:alpha-L-fucosidase 2